MVKKFLVGALTAVLMVEGALATTVTSEAATAPKATYTYNFNKANKNVVAVTRKGDTGTTPDGVIPTKNSKVKIKYQNGKNGKAIYFDRTYGVQLTDMKLKSEKYTISFWVKAEENMGNFMSVFFAGSNFLDENVKWMSITKTDWVGDSSPIVWWQDGSKGKMPWTGPWGGGTDTSNMIAKGKGWNHVTVVVGGSYKDKKNDINVGATSGYMDDPNDAGYIKSGPNVVIYVNGAMYGTGTCANTGIMNGKQSTFVGINCWDALFKGWVDDLQIYNKALTQAQVKAVYKSVGGK